MTTRARPWEKRFLTSLARYCNITQAAKDAGVGRRTVYDRRDASPDFAEKWDEALEEALDAVELAVYTESLKGDMQTARWFLSRRRPQVWGDKLALEHSGPGGDSIPLDVKVILDALNDPEAREALDALSRRLESQPSGDGS